MVNHQHVNVISEDPTVIVTPNPSTVLDEKVLTDAVKIDLRDHLTPHNDTSNPFAFTPEQLSALMDPKNLPLLRSYGGLEGVARGLHSDLQKGLIPYTSPHQNITLNQIFKEKDDSVYVEEVECKRTPTLHSLARQLTHRTDISVPTPDTAAFPQRKEFFGTNTLPDAKSKSIFHLMWIAFQDKTLILLAVAAVVSLGVGLYEDIAVPEYDTFGNRIPGVKWVEGVAIIVAILLVILVGSINDYQKEKQFRKLNAKKENRAVKATRNSTIIMISIHDIQVGDILHLEPGDIVPTDGIFIEGHNLKCDESAATGESDAVRKQPWQVCERLAMMQVKEDEKRTRDLTPGSSSSSEDAHKSNPSDPIVEHRSNSDPFIISGSKVLEGICSYLVTGIGENSYYGRTMMALRSEPESTPLQEKLNALAELIAKLGSAAGLLMLIVLLIRYFASWRYGVPDQPTEIVMDIMKILIVVVTIVVVAVPEGLPLAVTLALAYATQRMLKDNNLVRVLAACETMGNATTVCSDKTGTLTQNKMTVVAGTFGSSFRFIKNPPSSRSDLIDIKNVSSAAPKEVLNIINQSIAVNSTAFEGENEKGEPCFIGNKTETALLQFSRDTKAEHYDVLRSRWPIEQVYPFSSERKAMATVLQIPHTTQSGKVMYRVHIKGASEIILGLCSSILTLQKLTNKDSNHGNDDYQGASSRDLTEDDKDRIERIIQSYATRSLRTISIAYRDFEQWPPKGPSKNVDDDVPYENLVEDKGLTFLGVVGIEDPLREGVPEAVQACQRAGVFVRMVTGDNVVTAKSIAKQCGIYTPGGIVMEGPTFRKLPLSEMDNILPRLQVLARSSPEDKRILVSRLRELGDIVAVTGDGTNDGPALKMADVGFSMGIAGTEVAKEASSIILMDDNFSSIVKAIMWGRCVNDSVKKFLEFQITVNIVAVILTFISAVASPEQKSVLTAVQLLWVNLIMDTFAALALATDPPTEDVLDRRPEPRSAPLITFKMWKMIIGQAIFQLVVTLILLYSNVLNYPTESALLQTVVFNTFVFCQIFNEINCRRIDSKLNVFSNILANKFFIVIFFICIIGQVMIVQFGGAAFQVVPLNGVNWCIAIVIGLLSLPIGVIIRLIPDDIFGFLFLNPVTRDRYLGGNTNTIPSVYVAGNERMPWDPNERTNTMASRSSKHNDNQSFGNDTIRNLE
ncbi:PMCA-type calcium-translocating P-type ATPase [Cokeromyces recurvatus]|uniref:PMCA-type calcium-translocating P-type ATPase n=1 Tax=Cokeromyces recurvatus TaxID=90255 RepID=UPI00222095D6|nr:PMCA-type calcium-translocating P-type ATPase [Cokeromyces recurvatus]KAI7903186.1 PMCA-type calcium-translocating P-type ATPase [Cokeromyces recurvatus]